MPPEDIMQSGKRSAVHGWIYGRFADEFAPTKRIRALAQEKRERQGLEKNWMIQR
jgi:hypothetical protein